jgi:hypothetical protein
MLYRRSQEESPAVYLAFVMRAGQPDSVQMIELGDALEIDGLISDWRGRLEQGGSGATRTGMILRQALLDRLRSAMGESRRLIIAADGEVARVPFEALLEEGGSYLFDTHEISYVGTGRDVLRWKVSSDGATSPVVIGGSTEKAGGAEELPPPRWERGSSGGGLMGWWRGLFGGTRPAARGSGSTGERWEAREARVVAQMLGVSPWLGTEGLAGRLKEVHAPGLLHVRGRGYAEGETPRRGLRERGQSVGNAPGRLADARGADPLVGKGLQVGTGAGERLTLKELASLDLTGTRVVTVTGEGAGETSRAWLLAGAASVVVSLWAPAEPAREELLTGFYRRLLGGSTVLRSLREAQREVKARHPEPRFWSGFICYGNADATLPG